MKCFDLTPRAVNRCNQVDMLLVSTPVVVAPACVAGGAVVVTVVRTTG